MIYLDYASTTPCDKGVIGAMLPYFSEEFGNASSVDHVMGARARTAVEQARTHVASLVEANPEDVIFTSGSTEANNLVLRTKRPVVTSSIEHPSVLDTIRSRYPQSRSTLLPVDDNGLITEQVLRAALEDIREPALVSIMFVNNETGARQNMAQLAQIARSHNALFHSDATQGYASDTLGMASAGIEAVSISAHKIYGPKGVGALVCRSSLRRELSALLHGGGHERGLRSGTLNVPGLVGLGEAARLAKARVNKQVANVQMLRYRFIETLRQQFSGSIVVNGLDATTAAHICSVRLVGVNNRALLKSTSRDLCFSLGSACATTKNEPSHVLVALGQSKREANETIRVSFGAGLIDRDVDAAAHLIAAAANQLLQLVA